MERPVQAELAPELLDGLRRSLAAHHDEGGVAGDDVHEREGRHAEGEQHGDQGQHAHHDELEQRVHG